MKEILIDQNSEKQTLLKYLRRLFPASSDGFLYKMLRKKNIILNGKKAGGKEKLSAGDTVQIFFSDETFEKLANAGNSSAEDAFQALLSADFPEPAIIYECPDFLAVNKAPGLLSQKAEADDVSENELLLSYSAKKGLITAASFARFHPAVSNRLDRNTSGLLFFALTLKGQQFLTAMLRDRSLKKYYLAVVHGRPEENPDAGAYLKKDEKTNTVTVRERAFEGAREIHTGIEVLSSANELSLLAVHLITGAPHQIRAHLSFLGCPIVFDPKYGDGKADRRVLFERTDEDRTGANSQPAFGAQTSGSRIVRRQMLHSFQTIFPDGRTFTAPAADDMLELCKQFDLKLNST